MQTITVHLPDDDVAVLKAFFGTVSAGAAARSAVRLAQILAGTAKTTPEGREVLVHDQNDGGMLCVRVV